MSYQPLLLLLKVMQQNLATFPVLICLSYNLFAFSRTSVIIFKQNLYSLFNKSLYFFGISRIIFIDININSLINSINNRYHFFNIHNGKNMLYILVIIFNRYPNIFPSHLGFFCFLIQQIAFFINIFPRFMLIFRRR